MCNDYHEFPDSDWHRLEADWTSYNSWREAMDYEEAARFDRYDGYSDPYIGLDCAEPVDNFNESVDNSDFESGAGIAGPADISDFDDCPF